jgi:hypothetical protein
VALELCFWIVFRLCDDRRFDNLELEIVSQPSDAGVVARAPTLVRGILGVPILLMLLLLPFLATLILFKSPWTVHFSYYGIIIVGQIWTLHVAIFFPTILFIPQGFWTQGFNEAVGDLQAYLLYCFCDATADGECESIGLFPTAFTMIAYCLTGCVAAWLGYS